MFHKLGRDHLSKVKNLIKGAGYKSGGDVAQDKALISDAIHKHEKHDHPGKSLTKLKSGGGVDGKKSHHRLDKMSRGSKHKAGTKINVIVAPQGGKEPVPVPVPRPIPVPVKQAMNAPTSAPMPMAPAGGMPGQPPMKKGGKVGKYAKGGKIPVPVFRPETDGERDYMPGKKGGGECYKKGGAVKMTVGAASGEGRLEKAEIQESMRKKGK